MYLPGRFKIRLLKTIRTLLPLTFGIFNFGYRTSGASITLAWDASAGPNVAGYNVYYGAASDQYTDSISVRGVTEATVSGLADGVTYYFAATAFDSTGAESDFSNEVIVSTPPPDITISTIGTQTVQMNTVYGPISFSVTDSHADASLVSVNATSSNLSLLPNEGVAVAGTSSNRTITLTPSPEQTGSTLITITADDGVYTNSISFTVLVQKPNTPPTITAIGNQQIFENTSTKAISFTIADAETPANLLALAATPSNTSLISASGISLGGSGNARTITLTPAHGMTGQSTVLLTVNDGQTTASTSFLVTVVAPSLTISTNGNGTVTPWLTSAKMEPGKTYTLTAVPDKGQTFIGWSGTTNSSSQKLTFAFNQDYSLQASFVPSVYAEAAGAYSGLFYEDSAVNHESSGMASIAVSSRGTFSAKLQSGGQKYSYSGALGADLQSSNFIARGVSGPLTLWMRMGTNNEAGQLFGTVSSTNWSAFLHAERSTFNQKTNPAPFAGKYTIVFPSDPESANSPAGDGYGTVTVSASGRVAFAGRLADGGKATHTAPAFRDLSWPFYCNLYGGNGSALGWLSFTSQSFDDLEGVINWIRKPAASSRFYANGFTNETQAYGSFFNIPAPNAAPLAVVIGEVVFGGGNLSGTFTNLVALSGSKAENQSSNKLSLSISSGTGLFHGTVQDPATGEHHSFGGALIQKQNAGFGFLLGTNASSSVLFVP